MLLAVGAAIVASGPDARAAEVRVHAPCAEGDSIAEQVDGILGLPVASIDTVDFDVKIAAGGAGRWTLQVDTLDREAGTRRTRELAAATCAEAADAAAVAIAVSIKAATETRAPARRKEAEVPAPAPPPAVVEKVTRAPARAPEESRRTSVALAIVGDSGTLPKTAFGLELDASLRWRSLRLVGQGALFLPQESRLNGSAGGDFQLALAGVLACLGGEVGRVGLQACAGGEAGRLSGSGFGVGSPHSVATLWLAGRAEAGLNVTVAPRVALAVRLGAAVPFLRPKFELDATTVHRASPVTGRATAGVEVSF